MANHKKPEGKRRKPVLVTLRPDLHDELKRLADKHDMTVSRMIENLIIAGVLRDDMGKLPASVK